MREPSLCQFIMGKAAWIASTDRSNKTESTHIGPLATKEEIIDGFCALSWDILSRPTGAGKITWLRLPARGNEETESRGQNSIIAGDPVVFARLLVNNELNTGQVEARSKAVE